MELIQDFIEYEFLRNGLWVGLLASIACGVIGSFVVIRKISFVSGGISHSIFAGMGLAAFLNFSPLYGAILSALLTAVIIAWLSVKAGENEDTLISALWSGGVAIGILFIHLTPGYSANLSAYLFGNVLMTTSQDVLVIAILDVFILGTIFTFMKSFMSICFDEDFSTIQGLKPHRIYTILLCLVALTVVILVHVAGVILAIALLSIPAAIATRWTSSLKGMMLIASLLCAVFNISGLVLSYQFDFPSGAMTILVAVGFYLILAATKFKQTA